MQHLRGNSEFDPDPDPDTDPRTNPTHQHQQTTRRPDDHPTDHPTTNREAEGEAGMNSHVQTGQTKTLEGPVLQSALNIPEGPS